MADFNSKYTGEQVEALLDIVSKGGTGGGGGEKDVFVTDFTVTELEGLLANPTEEIPLHIDYLREAIVNHKVVLVPYSHSDEYQGYGIASGYIDDLLYVTICLNKGRYIDLELDYTYGGIYGHQVREREVPTTDSVITKSWVSEELGVADAQGLNDGNIIYALPSSANGDEDDILVSERTLKTINGQTIMRDGDSDDITIAYPEKMATSTTMELQPNTVTSWVGFVGGTIQITFAPSPQGHVSEYIARFTIGADDVQLIVPDNVVWADGVYPAMTNGKTYEISFVDNLATFLEF